MSKRRIAVLGLAATLIPLSFVGARYPRELILQHVPTVLAVVGLYLTEKRFRLSRISFLCLVLFLWLHIVGARWIYSFVPYDDWTEWLFGIRISDEFGWQRNHYDRFVHFASGVLGVPPSAEALRRLGGMAPAGAALMAISVVLSLGAVYEILEWQIAVTLSPQQAEAYNGQQGDRWDPQKDLALAGLGAIISAVAWRCWVRHAAKPVKN